MRAFIIVGALVFGFVSPVSAQLGEKKLPDDVQNVIKGLGDPKGLKDFEDEKFKTVGGVEVHPGHASGFPKLKEADEKAVTGYVLLASVEGKSGLGLKGLKKTTVFFLSYKGGKLGNPVSLKALQHQGNQLLVGDGNPGFYVVKTGDAK